jgi:hypothetical protein
MVDHMMKSSTEALLYRAVESGDKHVLDSLGMNLSPRCPECRKRRATPWVKNGDSGYACLSCGWEKTNEKPRTTEFLCGCGRRMGRLTVHGFDKTVKRICGWCAARRTAKNIAPNSKVLVRREVFCACGCKTQVAWTDFKETVPLREVEERSVYFHSPCAGKQRLFEKRPERRPRLHPLVAMSYTPSTALPGAGGLWWGGGNDGSLTLVANMTTASRDNVKMYTNVDLATFTLSGDISDAWFTVHVSGTLTSSAGGRITLTGTAGGAGGVSEAGSGAGGAGGAAVSSIFVYARMMTGTGKIGGGNKGNDGANGGPSTSPNVDGGDTGKAGANIQSFWKDRNTGTIQAQPSGAGVFSGAVAVGGAGATAPSLGSISSTFGQDTKDYLRLLFISEIVDATSGGGTSTNDNRYSYVNISSGGGSGASITINQGAFAGGGAGGGGGNGPGGAGGIGGNGSKSTAGNAASTGGGGGGGGGGIPTVVCVTTSISSTWTISADGGAGGHGGNGNGAQGGGGAGGGGGAAGVSVLVAPVGSGVAATADGGIGGTHGTGTNETTVATDGAAGAAGVAHNIGY